jgi:hypothetical protein
MQSTHTDARFVSGEVFDGSEHFFAPAPKPYTAAGSVMRAANTGQKVGSAAFDVVNLNDSS